MDVVQNLIDVATTIGQIQSFIEESDEIHQRIKCAKCPCPLLLCTNKLKNVIFNPFIEYDFCINVFICTSIEYSNVSFALFKLQNLEKKK